MLLKTNELQYFAKMFMKREEKDIVRQVINASGVATKEDPQRPLGYLFFLGGG
jgi:hypothetical protein